MVNREQAAAVGWSPKTLRSRRRAGRPPKSASRLPLIPIPHDLMAPVERVMKALSVDGQQVFREDMHRAIESAKPAEELPWTIFAWYKSYLLFMEEGFRGALERIPEAQRKAEEMTLEEFKARIGL